MIPNILGEAKPMHGFSSGGTFEPCDAEKNMFYGKFENKPDHVEE